MFGLANRMASFFIAQSAGREEHREIYVYGIETALSSIMNLICALILGIIFGATLHILLFFSVFFVLRSFMGGYHARTVWGCLLGSMICVLAGIVCFQYVPDVVAVYSTPFLSLFQIVLALYCAPVEHPNRPLSKRETKAFRKKAIIISAMIVLASVVLLFIEPIAALALSLGASVAAAMAALGKIIYAKEREK